MWKKEKNGCILNVRTCHFDAVTGLITFFKLIENLDSRMHWGCNIFLTEELINCLDLVYRNVLWCLSIGIGVNKRFDVCMHLLETIPKDCHKINSNMAIRYFTFHMSKPFS